MSQIDEAADATADEARRQWWRVLADDAQLWTHVDVPPHATDDEFLRLVERVRESVEELDCSDCYRLTQDAFLQVARRPVVLPNLRRLVVPTDLTIANGVYESLASSVCFPALTEIRNVQPGTVCDPLRCQTLFRRSALNVLNDDPVAEYGRARRLFAHDSVDHKQRRQRWESDLAKAAIYCPNVGAYRCSRGLGYVDDKSLERLSVLFPNLRAVALHFCSFTDDGLAKFIAHNRACGGGGGGGGGGNDDDDADGLTDIELFSPGQLTDASLNVIATRCRRLRRLVLGHCPGLTNAGIRNLVTGCAGELRELSLNVREAKVDNETLIAVGQRCKQLTTLKLFSSSFFSSTGLAAVLTNCPRLKELVLYGCHGVDDVCLSLISQHCAELTDLSLFSDCLTARGLVGLLMRAHGLSKLHIEGSQRLKVGVMKELAEETYGLLSNDVSCRTSNVVSLTLIGVEAAFVRLVTVLCPRLVSFHLDGLRIDAAASGEDGDSAGLVLCHVVDTCRQLKVLDVSGVANVGDEFLVCVCDKAVELRHLSLHFGPSMTADTLAAVVQIAPSLSSLTVAVDVVDPSSTSTTGGRTNDDAQNRRPDAGDNRGNQQQFNEVALFETASRFHDGTCHVRLFNVGAGKLQQFEFCFVPLKYLRCVPSTT